MERNYLDLLKEISILEPPVYIFGGFAEEALLHEKTTRPHDDIDILLLRKDTDDYVRRFQKLGFQDYQIYLHDPSGHPTVLRSEKDGLAIELCIFDEDKNGRVSFFIYGEPNETKYRIFLPEDTFDYKKTSVDGVEIQTISPLALYQIRAALGITKSFGGYRDKDVKTQQELKKKYFDYISEEELRPHIKTD